MSESKSAQFRVIAALAVVFLFTGGVHQLRSGVRSAPDFPCSVDSPADASIEIAKGATGSDIATQLYEAGVIKSSLAFFRLAVAVSVGQFSINALVLTLEALPVAYLVTTITASKHPPLSPSKLKALVCCLLIAVGAAMAITATMALTR